MLKSGRPNPLLGQAANNYERFHTLIRIKSAKRSFNPFLFYIAGSKEKNRDKMKLNTKIIHAGVEPDPSTGAIMTPIFQTSTFVQSGPNEHKGYDYSRAGNPTRTALENAF